MPLKIQKIAGPPEEVALSWAESAVSGDLLALEYELPRFWESSGIDNLVAVYEMRRPGVLRLLVCEADDNARAEVLVAESLQQLSESLSLDVFCSDQVIPLVPVHIAKPWGEEIWFTGMERRGVARAGSAGSTPLPWLLSALPSVLCGGCERNLMLLKILASRAEKAVGELYFELHEQKREVYVVTSVDDEAWPGGVGAIRLGFDQALRGEFAGDEHFRQAFAGAVAEYEVVRREIDALCDQGAENISGSLYQAEQELRATMNRFTEFRSLVAGDVVKVPPLTPHSLLHGIRAVEFQTPVYERLILSFAQKVLTQERWDTKEAVAKMRLDTPEQPPSELLHVADGVCVERIVDYEDFEVQRIEILSGGSVKLESPAKYAVLIGIRGTVEVDGLKIGPEDALLLPASHSGCLISNQQREPTVFLAGYPQT